MITKNSKNILLADDSVFFRTKLSAILIEAGHKVRFASDGEDVIKEIEIDPAWIDLLILDLQMPHIDGFGVLKWIQENGCRDKFPVLAITGAYEPNDVIGRLRGLGAKGLMTKGFTPEQVVYRINTLLFPDKAAERTYDRVPVSVPADFAVGAAAYTGFLLNISKSGLFLHTKVELLPGTVVSIKFSFPGMEHIIHSKGIVKWSTTPDEVKNIFGGAGVMFTSISEEDSKVIKDFVERELKKITMY